MNEKNVKSTTAGGGGGVANWFRRFWYMLVLHFLGIKWGLFEIFTKHRKLDWNSGGGTNTSYDIRKRKGEVAIITGGARGIGAEVVKKLLRAEMHVIIGCRKVSAGNLLISQIRESGLMTGTTEVLSLDLMSLESVRHFATQVLSMNCPVHVLLNNAGIMFAPFELTIDGYESHFQVNYLSHFLLSNLLLPKIAASTGPNLPEARIINVSSIAHYGGHINFEDLQMQKFFSPYLAYMTSKLLQVISSVHMDAKLKEQGFNKVRVYSVHPGIVQTELYEHLWWVNVFQFIIKFIFKTPEQGSDAVAYAALSSEIENEGGIYMQNSMEWNPNTKVFDNLLQETLWNASVSLLGPEDFNYNIQSSSMKNSKEMKILANRS